MYHSTPQAWTAFALLLLLAMTCVCHGFHSSLTKRQYTSSRFQRAYMSLQHESIPPLRTEPPRKVLLCVEPTPFNYISGYANRFQEMLKYLKQAGDDVRIFTADSDPNPPKAFLGFPILTHRGFGLPLYNQVTITFDLAGGIPKLLKSFQPDLLHVSTPSAMVIAATLWASIFKVPLVMSYHTDLVGYFKAYLKVPGAGKLAELLLKFFLSRADLVLCTSPQLKEEMIKLGITHVDVWQKGINTETFNPSFRDESTRELLSAGHPEAPLLLYVGRLGTEKKLERLKVVLDRNPGCRLAFVGKGPAEEALKKHFEGYPVVFAGQMTGEPLSRAFASADLFVMPSDTETLGFVVMEALASGVPVVGVRAGGLIDIIDDSTTGYLAENAENMDDFSVKVALLVNDQTLRSQYAQAAVNWAQRWSWETATAKLRNLQYTQALARFRSKHQTSAAHSTR